MGAAVLAEQLEGSAPGLVALAGQILQGLLAGGHLPAADDAAVLVLHQVLLLQTTGGMLGSAVEHLSLRANSHLKLSHLILVAAKLNEIAVANREWNGLRMCGCAGYAKS
jgi:hypothetical protein